MTWNQTVHPPYQAWEELELAWNFGWSDLLGKVKAAKFCMSQIVMDHDTSANAIVRSHFPDIDIAYCGNHTAKSFTMTCVKLRPLNVNARHKLNPASV